MLLTIADMLLPEPGKRISMEVMQGITDEQFVVMTLKTAKSKVSFMIFRDMSGAVMLTRGKKSVMAKADIEISCNLGTS